MNFNHQPSESLTVNGSFMAPKPLYFLNVVASSAKMINDFIDGFSEQSFWNDAAVVELDGKEHLEAPPLLPHRWFSL
jgi:hypothetical protein